MAYRVLKITADQVQDGDIEMGRYVDHGHRDTFWEGAGTVMVTVKRHIPGTPLHEPPRSHHGDTAGHTDYQAHDGLPRHCHDPDGMARFY